MNYVMRKRIGRKARGASRVNASNSKPNRLALTVESTIDTTATESLVIGQAIPSVRRLQVPTHNESLDGDRTGQIDGQWVSDPQYTIDSNDSKPFRSIIFAQ